MNNQSVQFSPEASAEGDNNDQLSALGSFWLNFKKTESIHNSVVEFVYSADSMASVLAAALIKRVLAGRTAREVTNGRQVLFTEVDRFRPSLTTKCYVWLDLPRLQTAFTKEVGRSFDKAGQHPVTELTDIQHDTPFAVALANQNKEMNGIEIRPIHTGVQYDTERQRINQELVAGHQLYVGPVVRSLAKMSELFLEISYKGASSVLYEAAELDRLAANFYSVKASAHDVCKAYIEMNTALAYLGQEHDEAVIDLDVSGYERMIIPSYRRKLQQVRETVQSQLEHCPVVIAGRGKRDDRTITVRTTRMHQDFWIARRIVCGPFNYFHNSRRVDYGTHVTTNLPAGHKGLLLRNLTTSTSPI